MKINLLAVPLVALVISASAHPDRSHNASPREVIQVEDVQYKTIMIGDLNIFYREAGDTSKPSILLLHGFPSSSHMYRDLLRDLAPKYHVVAPDYPGFGLSSCPDVGKYEYTFDNISITIEKFIDTLKLTELILYVQDYGGPVGFRIASRRPKLIRALIIQNANAYNEGLGDAIAPMKNYFTNPNEETEKGARGIFASTQWQYTDGAQNISLISPDSYIVDQFFLDRPGVDKIQLALFRDYKNNLALYTKWHSYFREVQPPALVLWGQNDKIFIAPGAHAYKKDLKNIEVHMLNGGHFVLEEHHRQVAKLIDTFLTKNSLN
jgi:pimeloyl-ACP methyl ester carboxylesterase